MKKCKFVPSPILSTIAFSILILIVSCRKNNDIKSGEKKDEKQIMSILDSIYLYAQQVYLWTDQLPTKEKFRPQIYYKTLSSNQQIQMYKSEIYDLTKFAVSLHTGKSFELNEKTPGVPKYSTIIAGNNINNSGYNQVEDLDIPNNYGLSFAVIGSNDIRLLDVDANSPAGYAGLRRGDKIVSLNGKSAETTDTYASYISSLVKSSYFDIIIKRNGTINKPVRLTGRSYDSNPVLAKKIIKNNGRVYGFVAYKSFTNEDNTRKFLEPVLYDFEANHITDIIIDLRYNEGGYQNSCIYIANNIIPSNLNNKLMFTEHYNSLMQSGKASILKNQHLSDSYTLNDIDYSVAANTTYFQKENQLNDIRNVYFIVSERTASASELLINVLKPYMNVVLVGVSRNPIENVKTYGKPVGFFDINISSYKLYLSMFQDKNANGEGDFFEGMPANYSVLDDATSDFGSLEDPAIQQILNYGQHKATLSVKTNAPTIPLTKYFLNRTALNGIIKSTGKLKFKGAR